MIKPELVARNFSRSAPGYEKQARFQKYAAQQLMHKLDRLLGGGPSPGRILEIGCGSGYLTESLFNRFPAAEFLISDIAAAMLEKCRANTAAGRKKLQIKARFFLGDIAAVRPPGRFDLIVSGLTFQWLPDLGQLLEPLAQSLNPQGCLAFSILGDGTFRTFRQTFRALDIPYPGPRLLTREKLISICARFLTVAACETELVREEFASTLDFLRQLRATGAGNATPFPLSPAELRRIIAHHDQNSPLSERQGRTIEYELIYLLLRKNP